MKFQWKKQPKKLLSFVIKLRLKNEIFAINGSHRKDGNTAQLLEKALEGIQSVCSDAEIESVNLYDIPFNGCKSCFACKKD